jgi:hypothetical protein
MDDPPPGQEKGPVGVDALRGPKRKLSAQTDGPRRSNAGRCVNVWAWGWPAFIVGRYLNGKGVRQ